MQNNSLTFLPFSDELAEDFYVINKQWIESMFVMEPHDLEVLQNPRKFILEQGGEIFFAQHSELGVVGTCALDFHQQGVLELTKMGVLESSRGLKVGEQLLHFVLQQPLIEKCKTLFLLTNKRCEAAIHLYEKLGFEHSQTIMQRYGALYQRCNVAMQYTRTVY